MILYDAPRRVGQKDSPPLNGSHSLMSVHSDHALAAKPQGSRVAAPLPSLSTRRWAGLILAACAIRPQEQGSFPPCPDGMPTNVVACRGIEPLLPG